MASKFAQHVRNKINDKLFGGTDFTPPGTYYVRLYTTPIDDLGSGGVEVTGNGYNPISIVSNTTIFPNAAAGSKSNNATFTFPTPTGSGWGAVKQYVLWDAPTGGLPWTLHDINGGAGLVVPPDGLVTINTGSMTIAVN